MAEKQGPENSEGSQTQANSGSTSVGSLNVGGNVGGNVTTANNNLSTTLPILTTNKCGTEY